MPIRSHADVLALWPSTGAFARAIGVKTPNARMMRNRGAIPEKHFHAVADAARLAGFPPITYADLVAIAPRKEPTDG